MSKHQMLDLNQWEDFNAIFLSKSSEQTKFKRKFWKLGWTTHCHAAVVKFELIFILKKKKKKKKKKK